MVKQIADRPRSGPIILAAPDLGDHHVMRTCWSLSNRPPWTVLAVVVLAAGCAAETPGRMAIAPPSDAEASVAAASAPARTNPVVAGRAARVFVMASLGADCKSGEAPVINVARPPAKGTVSFRPGQQTTIGFSRTGDCVGKPALGTGVYYTARAGETGADTFSIVGRSGGDAPMTQTFTVEITD